MHKKLITLIMAVIMVLSLATAFADTAETPAAAAPSMTTVLATVNGSEITLADVSSVYQYLASMYQSYGLDVTSEDAQKSLTNYAINVLVQEKVILDNAKKQGLDALTDEQTAELKTQAESAYESAIESNKSYFTSDGASDEDIRKNTVAYLDEQGYTVDTIMENLKTSYIYENVNNFATKDVAVTDEQVQTAYDEGVAAAKEKYAADLAAYDTDSASGSVIYFVPEGIRAVKHILVKVADAAELKKLKADMTTMAETDENYQKNLDRIAEIEATVQPKLDEIAKRIADGDDFQALIDEYGEDGGMKSGITATQGYLMSEATSRFVSEFKDAGMALENIGDISEPVLSDFGYHIIRYESDIPTRVVPFDEIKDAVRETLETSAKNQAYQDLITKWLGEATIEYAQGATE